MNKKRLRFAVGEDAPAASAAGRRGWCACGHPESGAAPGRS